MSRTIEGNRIAQDPDFVTQVVSGGTSATTAKGASQSDALDFPTEAGIGLPFGLAPLDVNGFIASNLIPNIILSRTGVQVSGPLSLGIGLQGTYVIQNYDGTKTYTVVALSGTASITGATITYTAPLQKGQSGFSVNGVSTNITIIDPADSPQITGPASLLENQAGAYTITNYDPYSTYNLTANQGSISRSGNTITFTAPPGDGVSNISVGFSINSANITVQVLAPPTPTISGPTSFPINTTQTFTIANYTPPASYYTSVTGATFSRNGATVTVNAGSTTGNFGLTINNVFYPYTIVLPSIAQPSILAPVNGTSNLGPTVNFTASGFAVTSGSDTQRASNWQLATDPAFSNLIQTSYNDTVNLTSWTVNNIPANTTFYARVQYIGNQGGLSSYSPAVSFSSKLGYTATAITSTLLPSVSGSHYGSAISISKDGNTLAVGAYYENYGYGSVSVYRNQSGTWTFVGKITGLNSNSQLGYAVALDAVGSYLLVTSPGDNSASIYAISGVFSSWYGVATLRNGVAPNTGTMFSSYCAITDDASIVAIGDSTSAVVYIFQRPTNGWVSSSYTQSIMQTGGSYFGQDVSLSIVNGVGTLAVGIYGGVLFYNNAQGSWNQINSITNSNLGAIIRIGINGNVDKIVISTNNNNVFYYNLVSGTWNLINTLTYDSSTQSNPAAVSMSEDGLSSVIGYPGIFGTQSQAPTLGVAFIQAYNGSSWYTVANLSSSQATSGFGEINAINSNGTVVVIGDDYYNAFSGAVYIAT